MRIFEGNELIFRFMLINISSGIAVGMLNFIIPVYALSLNATSTEIGLINGVSGIGDLLVVLPAGFLVDYFGSKKIYSASCVFGGMIIVLLSMAGTPGLLLLTMVLYGAARTFRATSMSASFFENMSAIGIKKAVWYKGSMSIGSSFIGPLVGGIAAIAVGFKNYFALTSIFLLAPLSIIIAEKNRVSHPQTGFRNSSFTDTSNHYRSLAKNRILMYATLTASLNTAFFMTFTTFVTVLVIRDLGLSPGIAATLISLRGAATILVVFFGGMLLSRNNNGLYLLAFITTILALLILGTGKDIVLLAIASVILGTGSGLITLVTFTQAGNIDGEKGKIAGVFSLGNGMGIIVGPTLGGVIGDAFGIQTIFLAFIPLFCVLTLYTLMDSGRRD